MSFAHICRGRWANLASAAPLLGLALGVVLVVSLLTTSAAAQSAAQTAQQTAPQAADQGSAETVATEGAVTIAGAAWGS